MLRKLVAALCFSLLSIGGVSSAQAGGVLRVGINVTDMAGLDPHRATQINDIIPSAWVFGGLLRFAPGNVTRYEPDLAERWSVSDDGLVWTFNLRRGVQFHRGFGEVTAEDVVYSFTRVADPARSSYAGDYTVFASVQAVDPYTVRITLKQPAPNMLVLVSNYHGGLIVSKKADTQLGADFRNKPVGFGPFEMGEHQPQSRVVFKAFDRYYRGRPKLDGIEYRFIPSDANRELAFANGELDIFYGRREQRWVERMKQRPKTTVDVFPYGDFRFLSLNRRIKPLDDLRVRQAIAHSIDPSQLVAFVGKDVSLIGRSVVPPGYAGELPGSANYPYDPKKARALLAEAGYPNGLTLNVVATNFPPLLSVMEILQNQLKQSGINMAMNVVDHPTFHAQIRKDLSSLVIYGVGRPPIGVSWLGEFFHSEAEIGAKGQKANFSHCAAGDADIDAARREKDADKQLAFVRAAQEKIGRDVCAIPLFDLLQVWVRRPEVDYGYKLENSLFFSPAITELTDIR